MTDTSTLQLHTFIAYVHLIEYHLVSKLALKLFSELILHIKNACKSALFYNLAHHGLAQTARTAGDNKYLLLNLHCE